MLPRIRAGKKETIIKDGKEVVLTGEVNYPCAILLEDPSLIELRKLKYDSDSEVFKAWERLGKSGLIPNNHDNKDRIEYIKNVKEFGFPE
jgi:hypothetical protein